MSTKVRLARAGFVFFDTVRKVKVSQQASASTTNFMADLMNKRLLKNSKEDKLDPPIHTEYLHT